MVVTDQMNYEVDVPECPKRIISLVPSQTELLFDLGLADQIVGITKFCIHPADKVKGKSIIGGTKNFNFDKIDALNPDLIIGNKEENYQEGILQLKEKYPVWISDISTLPEAMAMIQQIGFITNTSSKAHQMAQTIANSFRNFNCTLTIPTAYFIWRKPYMSVGQNTFIHHLLTSCGFKNVFGSQLRYPEISVEQLQQANPKLILLSSENYNYKEKHIQ